MNLRKFTCANRFINDQEAYIYYDRLLISFVIDKELTSNYITEIL